MNVKEFLTEHDAEYTSDMHPPRYTSQEVAAAEHVTGRKLAKTVIVRAGSRFVMAVVPATRMIDLNKLGEILGERHVRLAEEFEMSELFPDSELGAEPPFGEPYGMETIIDRQLTMQDEIVFRAGTHREIIRMRYADYERIAEPIIADFTKPAEVYAS